MNFLKYKFQNFRLRKLIVDLDEPCFTPKPQRPQILAGNLNEDQQIAIIKAWEMQVLFVSDDARKVLKNYLRIIHLFLECQEPGKLR